MNMYVANLSFAVGEKELSELFAAFGEVSSVKIITDRETGRSRGFAFVEMSSDEEAKTAMAALNNKEVGGRPLAVSEARKKTDNDNRFSGRGRSGNSKW